MYENGRGKEKNPRITRIAAGLLDLLVLLYTAIGALESSARNHAIEQSTFLYFNRCPQLCPQICSMIPYNHFADSLSVR